MSPLSDTSTLDLDTRLLSNFIYELNIARRHVIAYPDNHPIIASTLSKVTNLLCQLLSAKDEITLGVAKDTLLVGDSFLDKNNPVYRDLARLFFGHGCDNAYDEAAWLILHTLHLPIDRLDPFLDARLVRNERLAVFNILQQRIARRTPAASIRDI